MEWNIHVWQTGRSYSEHGQRIAVVIAEEKANGSKPAFAFQDFDRCVDGWIELPSTDAAVDMNDEGEFEFSSEKYTQMISDPWEVERYIMAMYDARRYQKWIPEHIQQRLEEAAGTEVAGKKGYKRTDISLPLDNTKESK